MLGMGGGVRDGWGVIGCEALAVGVRVGITVAPALVAHGVVVIVGVRDGVGVMDGVGDGPGVGVLVPPATSVGSGVVTGGVPSTVGLGLGLGLGVGVGVLTDSPG